MAAEEKRYTQKGMNMGATAVMTVEVCNVLLILMYTVRSVASSTFLMPPPLRHSMFSHSG